MVWWSLTTKSVPGSSAQSSNCDRTNSDWNENRWEDTMEEPYVHCSWSMYIILIAKAKTRKQLAAHWCGKKGGMFLLFIRKLSYFSVYPWSSKGCMKLFWGTYCSKAGYINFQFPGQYLKPSWALVEVWMESEHQHDCEWAVPTGYYVLNFLSFLCDNRF